MFRSIYSDQLLQYYELRSATLGDSARKHELLYLCRFDAYIAGRLKNRGGISASFINEWVGSLSGKSGTVENEVIVVRQFLAYLGLSGERVVLPIVPKVRDDYVPYIFSDEELDRIFTSADNIVLKDPKADPYMTIEFPVILRLLYSCGLRVGETVKLDISDVNLDDGILRMLNAKGDKHRIVPMSNAMTEILTRYCVAMRLYGKGSGWLFPASKDNGHISDKAVKRRFEAILSDNGMHLVKRKKHERGPCLHCLRHVFAFKSFSQAERQGRHLDDSIPFLSIYLGHDGINETAKYLKFSNELFPESIDAFGDFMSGLLPEVDYET